MRIFMTLYKYVVNILPFITFNPVTCRSISGKLKILPKNKTLKEVK